jgi:MFS transporter, DHA1 family, tetracycline resistance protein
MNSNSKYFIFITVLIDAMGIGIVIPVMPTILKRFLTDSHDQSTYFGYFAAVFALVQFFAAPILGNLADAFGRRKVLLLSLFGAAIDYLLMAFAPNLFFLFLGRIVAGFTSATHSVAASCMADISTPENRAGNFGLIGAAFGLGFIFGPAIGGMLGAYGETAPFIAAACFCFLNFLYGTFVLPETLSMENRRPFQLSGLNSFATLAQLIKLLPLPSLFLCYFLLFLAGNVHPSIWTLYTTHKFNWSSFDVGLSLSFVGICIAFFQGFAVKICVKKFGERITVLSGVASGTLAYFLISIAAHGWQAFALCLFFGFTGVAMPTIQGLFSKLVPANQQGSLQGGLMAIGSITSMLAPLIYSQLFGFFSQLSEKERQLHLFDSALELPYFPGAGYLCAAVFCFLSGVCYLRAQKQTTS